MPSHESEALEDKHKLQMKTFSETCRVFSTDSTENNFVRTFFKYNYVGCLLLLMSSNDLLLAIKRDAYIFKETG